MYGCDSVTWEAGQVHGFEVGGLDDCGSEPACRGQVTQREIKLPEISLLLEVNKQTHTHTRDHMTGKTRADRYPSVRYDCLWSEKSYICERRQVTAGVLMWTGRASRQRGKRRHCKWIMCQSADVAGRRKVLRRGDDSPGLFISLPSTDLLAARGLSGTSVMTPAVFRSHCAMMTPQWLWAALIDTSPGETPKYAERLMLKTYFNKWKIHAKDF